MGFTLIRATSRDEDKERERKRRVSRTTELSHDVIVEILLRLPVRSLLRFKCVCRLWYESIISPDFTNKHNNSDTTNIEKVSLYLCWNDLFLKPSTTSTTISFRIHRALVDITIPVPTRIARISGCSNGIVCLSLSVPKGQDFVLWNPATRRYQLIPRLSPQVYSSSSGIISDWDRYMCGFCFDPVAKTYKVAGVTFCPSMSPGEGSIAQVFMFTTKDNSWRTKILQVPSGICCCSITAETSVKTSIYWMTNIGRHYCDLHPLDDGENYILCFDMVDESFKRIKLPPFRGDPSTPIAYKESIAIFVRRRSGFSSCGYAFDVWVLNDDDDQAATAWSKQLTFAPTMDVPNAVGFLGKSGDDVDDWVVLSTHHRGKYYKCNPKTGEMYSLFADDQPDNIFLYSESLASV